MDGDGKLATKDMIQKQQDADQIPQEQIEGITYHWVYVTLQGQDIEVQVTPAGHEYFTVETPWYRAQIQTYDLLETVVRFCQKMYGAGTLTLILS